ncbi:MAG TPA: flagellar motor switch protein FliN [Acidimicrobiales bacterium]|jgi:flagellar motor switch protein FliN/FliY|nr:flagellar motor switch protein FliN [Acidimicrobiales bacterium]
MTVDAPETPPSSRRDILADVPLEIEVTLGTSRMTIRDVRQLGIGSVVELDRGHTDPVDITVNGKFFGKGELVVVDDQNFGVRITEIAADGPERT